MNTIEPIATPLERRIHVLQIVGNAIVGGMETFVLRLVQRLPKDRFRVSCLCPNESGFTAMLRAAGAEVYVTPIPEEPVWRSIQMGCVLSRSESVDVIHAHLANAHVLAGLIGKLCELPVLATIHGRDIWIPDLEMHRLTGSHLCMVSQASYFQALGVGAVRERVHCIPNGVDTEMFQPAPPSGRLQRALGLGSSTPLVGFIGRLSPEKGPEVFIRAAAIAASATAGDAEPPHFVVIGDGPMRARLVGDVNALGLTPRVHFAGVRDDMPEVYRDLDVVASCSWSEGLPLALMEAMACARAVVATQVGGVPELIVADSTGKLYSAGHAEGIAQGMLTFLRDPAKRAAVGAAARARVEQSFELSDRIEQLGGLLTRLAEGRSSRRISALTPVKNSSAAKAATAAVESASAVRSAAAPRRLS